MRGTFVGITIANYSFFAVNANKNLLEYKKTFIGLSVCNGVERGFQKMSMTNYNRFHGYA
jgi:hypothetical protein